MVEPWPLPPLLTSDLPYILAHQFDIVFAYLQKGGRSILIFFKKGIHPLCAHVTTEAQYRSWGYTETFAAVYKGGDTLGTILKT
jgi:hypothetical protein